VRVYPSRTHHRLVRMPSTSRPSSVPPALGDRIACARAIAILGMIYVHVPGAEELIVAGGPSGITAQFLVDGIGRASAALLAVVSGWLVATALLGARTSPGALIRRRAGTTIRPMLFWAAITVVLYSAVSLARPTFLSVPFQSGFELVVRFLDTVFFVTPSVVGPTVHLSFLRDLFMCVVLAWPLLRLLRTVPGPTLSVLGAIYLSQIEIYLILRPLVLFSFAIGMSLSLYHVRLDSLDRWWPAWLSVGCVATAAIVAVRAGAVNPSAATMPGLVQVLPGWRFDLLESVLYPLTRLCWTLTLWCATVHLVARPIAGFLRRQSPWIFTTFCSHFLTLTVLWSLTIAPLSGRLSGAALSITLVAWFLVAPLLAFAMAYALMRIMATLSPTLAVLGGVPPSLSLLPRRPIEASAGDSCPAPTAGIRPSRPWMPAVLSGVPTLPAPGTASAAMPRVPAEAIDSGERHRDTAERAEVREQAVAG